MVIKLKKIIRNDLFICLVILIIATLPRIIVLDKIPNGLHGDEGWTGIDALRILDQGFIEPYTLSALGQPTGPMYLTAWIFRILGVSIFSLRFSMAIFAILTIPSFYIFLRLFFSKKVSFLGTMVFSFSLFHLHYSRIAFMLNSVPLFQLWTLIFFIKGIQEKKLVYYALSGIFCGVGMYSYNVYIIFPVIIFLYLFYELFQTKFKKQNFINLGVLTFCFLVISFPLLNYILLKPELYFSHHRTYSYNKMHLEDLNTTHNDTIRIFFRNGLRNTTIFFTGNVLDYGDGYGSYYSINYAFLILFFVGVFFHKKKRDKWHIFFLLSMLFSILVPSFLTRDGIYRRKILSLIYIFYFVSNAIDLVSRNKRLKLSQTLFPVVILSIASIQNLFIYFLDFPKQESTQFVFTYELTELTKLINKTNATQGTLAFFSDRWSCEYETVRFLLPNIQCEDYSDRFGTLEIKDTYLEDTTIVLHGKYLNYQSNFDSLDLDKDKYEVVDPVNKRVLMQIYK